MTGSRSTHWILCFLVVAAVGVAGCSSDTTTSGESTGSLDLSLELAPGVVINEVKWVISGPDMRDMEGTIDTSASGSTASVEVFGLPPGGGYTVTLTAMVEGEEEPCIGSADFSVEVGVSTPVMVMLNCKRPERLGGVRVNGEFNVCADLAKVIVSPLQTSVGNDIDLSALAQDVDDDQGDIRYRWTATGGTIDDPNDRITTYTCEEVGEDHTILIRVSDDPGEFGEFCMDEWDVDVTCVPADEPECETDDDCDELEICSEQFVCIPDGGCNDDDDCEELEICNDDDECEAVECKVEDDCGELELCIANSCFAVECKVEDDCGGLEICTEDNECEAVDCKVPDDCDEDLGQCWVSTCIENTCGEAAGNDGELCDSAGIGDGRCMDGNCVEMDECETALDCTDDDLFDCVAIECILGSCEMVDIPAGVDCTDGGVCDGEGNCVGCLDVSDCDDNTGQCSEPICMQNMCDEAPLGQTVVCNRIGVDDGFCNGQGNCVECNGDGQCAGTDVCTDNECVPDVVVPVTKLISLGCTNNLTTAVSILPWVLDAAPQDAIVGGQAITIGYGGTAIFTESFLDAGLAAVPGLNKAAIAPGNRGGATVVPRAGLTGGDASGVELEPAPVPTTCAGGMNAGGACVDENDCPPVGYFACAEIVNIPTIDGTGDACAECNALGAPKDTQCADNGFCITPGGLPLTLESKTGSYTVAASGTVLLGWDETNQGGTNPDGTYILNAASFGAPWQPGGLRVLVGILQIALNCVMAVDSDGPDGVGVPDQASPTPDNELVIFAIQ